MVMRKEKEYHITIEKFQLTKMAKANPRFPRFLRRGRSHSQDPKGFKPVSKETFKIGLQHADLARMDIADLFSDHCP